jgi:hypothetical protein
VDKDTRVCVCVYVCHAVPLVSVVSALLYYCSHQIIVVDVVFFVIYNNKYVNLLFVTFVTCQMTCYSSGL